MEVTIRREPTTNDTTLGEMRLDGVFFCYTLEDAIRPVGQKVYGQTAIPAGRYRLTITWSPKFQKDMVLVNDVPGFTGIRIHSGNTKEDTLGCPLVGSGKDSSGRIHGGSAVMPVLFDKIKKALTAGEPCFLDVIDPVTENTDGN